MNRALFLIIAMSLSSLSYGTCQNSSYEIGDTGPDDALVCIMLNSRYPGSEIRIVNREIHDANRVSVLVEVDDRPQRFEYLLNGYEWRPGNTGLLTDQRK